MSKQCVVVVGTPGLGKSRFISHMLNHHKEKSQSPFALWSNSDRDFPHSDAMRCEDAKIDGVKKFSGHTQTAKLYSTEHVAYLDTPGYESGLGTTKKKFGQVWRDELSLAYQGFETSVQESLGSAGVMIFIAAKRNKDNSVKIKDSGQVMLYLDLLKFNPDLLDSLVFLVGAESSHKEEDRKAMVDKLETLAEDRIDVFYPMDTDTTQCDTRRAISNKVKAYFNKKGMSFDTSAVEDIGIHFISQFSNDALGGISKESEELFSDVIGGSINFQNLVERSKDLSCTEGEGPVHEPFVIK